MAKTTEEREAILAEEAGVAPIEAGKRKSIVSIGFTTAAQSICIGGLYLGGSLAAGLSFRQVIIATLIGLLILAVLSYFQAYLGTKYGVSTSVLSRHAFGRQGSRILGLVLAITMGIGWFGYQVAFFGQTIYAMFGDHFLTQPEVAMVWGAALMITTALVGFKALSKLSMVAVPAIVALCVWGVIAAVNFAGGGANILEAQPLGDPFSILAGVTVVVGGYVAGAVTMPDVTRYGKKPNSTGWVSALGYIFGGAVCIIPAAAMTFAASGTFSDTANIPAIMAQIGLGVPAFLVLLLAQWTTNDNNLYTGALGFCNIFRVPKKYAVIGLGILGTAIALLGAVDYFVPFLNFLGVFLPPIIGIIFVDYFYVSKVEHRAYTFDANTTYKAWNVPALASILIGGLMTYFFLSGFGIASITSTLLSALLYAGWTFVASKVRVRKLAAAE